MSENNHTQGFADFKLGESLLEAVKDAGYDQPTPVQLRAIPPAIEGRDVVGLAQTGSGKTAAFALPMLRRLETGRARARMPRTLVLEPTRELAAQVQETFETLGERQRLSIALLIGGVSFDAQNRILERGADVLIATPGRLLDHHERGKLLLTGVEMFVLDEADRMLDMGFIPAIERIRKLLPPRLQTMLFSATMPDEIARLADSFLNDPTRVEVARHGATAETIRQLAVAADDDPDRRRDNLQRLLRSLERDGDVVNAIVFANRKTTVGSLERVLIRRGFNAVALHGDMDQHARMKALGAFRDGSVKYLIASDVAARGLDIPDVSHVINFDVPFHADDYVHRIGRTGRAGREGKAISLVSPSEAPLLEEIEKLTHARLEWMSSRRETTRRPPPPRRDGGRSPLPAFLTRSAIKPR